jgi:RNA-splicing ligase RtcB
MINFKNYSDRYDWEILNWLPRDLNAEEIIILPDVNPGKAPLPTGCVVKTKQDNWRKFAVSDVGCGMILLRSNVQLKSNEMDFKKIWNQIVKDLQNNKGKLGDLGSGNHFLDAIQTNDDDSIYFLIHTGSRDESSKVEALIESPKQFDKVFQNTVSWAEQNRLTIAKLLEKHFGKLETVVHNNHNHNEEIDGHIIIRKGAVKLTPNELTVIPSHMSGEIALVRGKNTLEKSLYSLSHGTGRLMSRSEAKEISKNYNFEQLRDVIYIPESIGNESLRTEAPFCYRPLDDVLLLLDDLMTEEKRFTPFAYIGHI